MSTDKSSRKSFHEEFAAKVIDMLEKGTAPWQKPWTPAEYMAPHNPHSGTVYKGGNRIWLSLMSMGDPRWMTFKQAQDAGYRIRKGSKSVPIEFFQFHKEEDRLDEEGRPVLDEEGNPQRVAKLLLRPILRQYRVFNGADIEGLPTWEPGKPLYEWEPLEKAEEILKRSGAVIMHDQADRAFYMPARDEIHLPPKGNFDAPDKYYATALHELGHWSGHESRLQREFGPRGSTAYAKEELRAEIASWMLGQDIGTGHDPGQHAAYVRSWIQALKEDPLEIMRACRDAEQIKEYVLGLDREHVLENVQQVEPEKGRLSSIVGAVPMDIPEAGPLEPAAEKTWLHVSYRERYEAKALGARWDKAEKSWYAPPGTDLAPLRKFISVAKEPAKEKQWLTVPYAEKDDAKSLGAKFDRKEKRWFAPEGTDLAPLARWMPTSELEHQPVQPHLDPVQEFSERLQALGLDLQGKAPLMDGMLHRVPLLEKQGKGLDGAYRIYGDGQPAGWAQNFVSGEQIKLRATGVRLTPEEQERQRAQIEAQRQEREQALQTRHREVAREARYIWDDTPQPPPKEHPYLKAKGIEATDIREDRNGNLLIPLYRPDSGELRGLQYIAPDGKKSFMPGMEKQGNCHIIKPSENVSVDKASILICEGYATGVSLSMAAPDKMVVVAFDAGNLRPVSRSIRELHPEADITLCADNDHDKIRNTGVQKAEVASFLARIKLKVPSFTEAEMAQGLTDFNDMHQARGLEAVRKELGLTLQKGVER